jgi:hypothetical protein
MPGGDTEASFVDIHDIASVAAKVLEEHDGKSGRHIGKAYNIKYLSFSSVKSEAKVILKTRSTSFATIRNASLYR